MSIISKGLKCKYSLSIHQLSLYFIRETVSRGEGHSMNHSSQSGERHRSFQDHQLQGQSVIREEDAGGNEALYISQVLEN